jgi:N-carbamoyl-L-amino-acid hydrolase
MNEIRINGERLWSRLMEMATHGALPGGGCNRQALTDEDRAGRELFMQWCRDIGCEIRMDAVGNIFARRAGSDATMPPVITGSHLDTTAYSQGWRYCTHCTKTTSLPCTRSR